MQIPYEVTVDLKLVVHAENASEAQGRVRGIVARANFPGASAIFAVLVAGRLAHAELQDVQPLTADHVEGDGEW